MICFKIYTILDNEEEINQFLECCGGKFSKTCPTQPPSMCHNVSMGMPVSHLTRGWLPDVASTGSASRLNVSTRDFRVDFTPVLSLLCIASIFQSPTQTTQWFSLATWPQSFKIWMGHPWGLPLGRVWGHTFKRAPAHRHVRAPPIVKRGNSGLS